jgi:hypothetical protein
MKLIKKTETLCNACLKTIPAEVYESNNKIYMKKICKEHGSSTQLHRLDDPQIYNFISKLRIDGCSPAGLFLEITRRCNLDCNYCYTNSGPKNSKED